MSPRSMGTSPLLWPLLLSPHLPWHIDILQESSLAPFLTLHSFSYCWHLHAPLLSPAFSILLPCKQRVPNETVSPNSQTSFSSSVPSADEFFIFPCSCSSLGIIFKSFFSFLPFPEGVSALCARCLQWLLSHCFPSFSPLPPLFRPLYYISAC